jgi:hypothetical protein
MTSTLGDQGVIPSARWVLDFTHPTLSGYQTDSMVKHNSWRLKCERPTSFNTLSKLNPFENLNQGSSLTLRGFQKVYIFIFYFLIFFGDLLLLLLLLLLLFQMPRLCFFFFKSNIKNLEPTCISPKKSNTRPTLVSSPWLMSTYLEISWPGKHCKKPLDNSWSQAVVVHPRTS